MTTTHRVPLSRREFLIRSSAIAGGMCLYLTPLTRAFAAEESPSLPTITAPRELSAWIAIDADNTVRVSVPTPEIGNGASTQVAMNVAEELECAWSDVRVEFAQFAREVHQPGTYAVGGQPFFGGHGTDHDRMRHALQLGASARERLKAAAARRWKVTPGEVEARNGRLTHSSSGRSVTFGEMAEQAAATELDAEPQLKSPEQWRLLGKASPAKLQLPQIVTGRAVYGIDVQVPGMVYAALAQAQVHGGRLKHHDPSAVMKMPGVRAVVVVDPRKTPGSPVPAKPTFGFDMTQARSAVAVIADHYWQARQALAALPVEWDAGLGAYWKSNDVMYARQARQLDRSQGHVAQSSGDVASVTSDRIVEGRYRTPFCEHAAMEPLNGTARFSDEGLEVWHPCQDMQQAFWVAVDESGLPPEKVKLNQTMVGGGFGRRVMAGDVRMVVAVARQYPGNPVKVIWSREETFRQGQYRTMIGTRYKSALGSDGMPQSLEGEACYSGMAMNFSFSDTPYAISGVIPNVRLATSKLPMHFQTGPYRGPCYNSHAFSIETFIDECAMAAGADPVDYRAKLLAAWDPAWVRCLEVAAQKSEWGRDLPRGEGMGVAISSWPSAGLKQSGTIVCAVVHAKVSPEGALSILRIDVTFDCGRVANRDAVAAQIEGATIYGLNMTLNEELTIENGAVVEGNYDRYPMLRLRDVPPIHVHFDALSGHERFGMIGEAPVGAVGPALGNAIYRATGKRLRSTPFRKHLLEWST